VAFALLERLTRYQEIAEKTVMEATIVNMRSGLRMRVAELMVAGEMSKMASLMQENPITWLSAPPINYGGLFKQQSGWKPQQGEWYFDATRKQLVYFPQRQRFFQSATGIPVEVRLQVMARSPTLGLASHPTGLVEGLVLVLLTPYRWDGTI
ncbi:MAG: hypothetical protein ABI351_13270, partial [Herbaspirillum sp.]